MTGATSSVGVGLDCALMTAVPDFKYPLICNGVDELLVEFHVSPAKMVSVFSAEISYYFCRLPPKVTNLVLGKQTSTSTGPRRRAKGTPFRGLR